MGKAISGFPELLPEQELVQQQMIDRIRESFELHGFTPLRTRAVEPLDVLLAKGDTDKEIYGVHRLGGGPEHKSKNPLGLHYDLTVPFARFVGERRGQLVFPFRRYQIQSAWRGERPQLGRYREFIQADADVVAEGELALRHDADMVALLAFTVGRLPIPPVKLLVNNRKVLEGFYLGLGVEDTTEVLRLVDKLPKIGADGVQQELGKIGLREAQVQACIGLAQLELPAAECRQAVNALGVSHPLLTEGLAEIEHVLAFCEQTVPDADVVAAFRIARGFNYYTGTVVEGIFTAHPELGSVCSGGRYDKLAGEGAAALPGVGISIGVSRIIGYLAHLELLPTPRRCPTQVFVVVHDEASRAASNACAAALRARGISCLVSDSTQAYGKQIKRATKLGIRYAWFPGQGDKPDEVKDLDAGEQAAADRGTWTPA